MTVSPHWFLNLGKANGRQKQGRERGGGELQGIWNSNEVLLCFFTVKRNSWKETMCKRFSETQVHSSVMSVHVCVYSSTCTWCICFHEVDGVVVQVLAAQHVSLHSFRYRYKQIERFLPLCSLNAVTYLVPPSLFSVFKYTNKQQIHSRGGTNKSATRITVKQLSFTVNQTC